MTADPHLPMGVTTADTDDCPEPETCQWCRKEIVDGGGCGCGEPGDEL